MKRINDALWVLIPLLAVCAVVLGLPRDVSGPLPELPDTAPSPEYVLGQSRDDAVLRALGALQGRLDDMARNNGGRYQFMLVKGRFLRLDTHEGKIAFYDDVSEASWNTLRLKEQEIGPESGYYRNYVNFLRTLSQP